jgi:hypothetical protein
VKSMVGVRSSSARQWSSLVGERSSWVRSARVRRWWSAGPGDRVRSWVAWWARRFRRRLGGRIVEDRQQRVRRGHVDDVDRRRRFSGLCEEDAEAGDQRGRARLASGPGRGHRSGRLDRRRRGLGGLRTRSSRHLRFEKAAQGFHAPVDMGADGPDRYVENLGDLGLGAVLVVTQHKTSALALGQLLQRHDHLVA